MCDINSFYNSNYFENDWKYIKGKFVGSAKLHVWYFHHNNQFKEGIEIKH